MNDIIFDPSLANSQGAERFAMLLRHIGVKNAGRRFDNKRQASFKTQEESIQYCYRMGKILWGLGFQIQKPHNINVKHIDVLLKYVWSQNKSAGTYSVWISQVRKLISWLKIPVKIDPKNYVPESEWPLLKRRFAAKQSKSLTGNGVDIHEVILRADTIDPRFGAMVRLELYFGLRRKEVLRLMPHLDDCQYYLNIRPGTAKGGRSRTIQVETAEQRAALEHAKGLVGLNEHLGWPSTKDSSVGSLLRANEQKYNYHMRKLGLTKNQLGLTGHSLRAQYAEDSAQRRGFIPATCGGGRGQLTGEQERLVRRKVAELMGHSRVSVTGAYYGTVRSVTKTNDERP